MARKGPTSTGKCGLCARVLDKAAMTTHLKTCKKKHTPQTPSERKAAAKPVFHLLIEGRYLPQYWMHVLVRAEATLTMLDEFLRDTWLECCGHMSAFTIDGTMYSAHPMEMDDRSMNVKLSTVLSRGMKFSHEYDFGSTTHLQLKVVSEEQSDLVGNRIRLLARNEPPALVCDVCGKPAVEICMECLYSQGQEGLLCETCVTEHKCDEEMRLPVVNSPRMGVCGYTG